MIAPDETSLSFSLLVNKVRRVVNNNHHHVWMVVTPIKHKFLRYFDFVYSALYFPINKYFASEALLLILVFFLPSKLIYADDDCCSKGHKFYDDRQNERIARGFCL